MKAKTAMRLMGAILLGVGYWLVAPKLLRSGQSGTPLKLHEVKSLQVEGITKEPLLFERSPGGDWMLAGYTGIKGDRFLIDGFLAALQSSAWKAGGGGGAAGVKVILRNGGSTDVIQLGARLDSLRSQRLFVNGKPYEIGADLNAYLGIWNRADGMGAEQLIERTIVFSENNPVHSLILTNPFSKYQFERGDDVVETRQEEGQARDIFRWRLANLPSQPANDSVQHYADRLGLVAFERLATSREAAVLRETPFKLEFITARGGQVALAISGPVGDKREHVCRLLSPVESSALVISRIQFSQLIPAGVSLLANIEPLKTGAEEAVAVLFARGKHQCGLKKVGGGQWEIQRPTQPYKVFTPPAMPGEKSVSTVQSYIENLRQFMPSEYFDVRDPQRQKAAQAALAAPAARAVIQLSSGKKVEVSVSSPVTGTQSAYMSIDNQIIVVNESAADVVAPDIATFFDPQEIEGKVIQW